MCAFEFQLARRNSTRQQKKHYPYVVIGAGTTAHAAIEAIKQCQPDADILIITEENVRENERWSLRFENNRGENNK